MPIEPAALTNWFTYHPPSPEQIPLFGALRAEAHRFAEAVVRLTPPGPDQDAAIRAIRQAVAWANAAIACGGR